MHTELIMEEALEKSTQSELENKIDKPFSQNILLIEDDEVCLFVAQEIFSRLSSGKIDTARTVLEAAEKLQASSYDLVVSDLRLGEGDAREVISAAKTPESPNKNTIFVALTGYREPVKHQEALNAGFKEVVTKPLTEDQAIKLIRNCFIHKADRETLKVERPVIDLQLGMERIGVYAKDKVLQVLELLIISLSEDLALLKEAENKQDRVAMQGILHKLIGALHYSPTPALEKSVQDLQENLNVNPSTIIAAGIEDVDRQVKALKAAYYDWLMYEVY